MCYEGQRALAVAAPKVSLSLAVGILLLLRLRSSEIDLLRVRVVVESRWSLVPTRIWLSMGSVLLRGFADLLLLVEEEVDGRSRSVSLHGGGGRTASGGQLVACLRDEALFFSFWLLLLVYLYLGVSRGGLWAEGGIRRATRTVGA
jgi:hypothetical protein